MIKPILLRITMNTGEVYNKDIEDPRMVPLADFNQCDSMGTMFNITNTFMINPNFVKTIQVVYGEE